MPETFWSNYRLTQLTVQSTGKGARGTHGLIPRIPDPFNIVQEPSAWKRALAKRGLPQGGRFTINLPAVTLPLIALIGYLLVLLNY
jgi:hypothetical protein